MCAALLTQGHSKGPREGDLRRKQDTSRSWCRVCCSLRRSKVPHAPSPTGVKHALRRCFSLEPKIPAQVWEGRGCCWKWWEHLDSWLCWLSPLTGNQELRKGRRLCVYPGCEGLGGRQRRCGQLPQHSCPGQRSQSILTTPTTGS